MSAADKRDRRKAQLVGQVLDLVRANTRKTPDGGVCEGFRLTQAQWEALHPLKTKRADPATPSPETTNG